MVPTAMPLDAWLARLESCSPTEIDLGLERVERLPVERKLAHIDVCHERLQELGPDNEALSGVYPFAFVDETTTQGRFFALPEYGIPEDPVTGTASGALGGYLIANDRMPSSGVLRARQGYITGPAATRRIC